MGRWLTSIEALLLLTCMRSSWHVEAAPSLLGTYFGIPSVNATFDYVIVGGGTSGLTVAKRLVETPGTSVAVIEAGSFYEYENGNISQIPAYAARGTTGAVTDIQPLIDWGFITVPQAGLNQRKVHYAQGKTLGGGSARNVLVYQRGTKGAYQQWADIVGDQSFTFANLLPYFMKSPNFTPPNQSKRPAGDNVSYDASVFSSQGGPLQVSYPNYRQPFTPFIQAAFTKLGLSSLPGLNSGDLIGFAEPATTIDPAEETRSSSQTSFLQTAIEAGGKITVYTRTSAQKIMFDGNKTANGVMVSTGTQNYILSARKEVIVAAGVFKTPQLLMVSGVGPSSALQRLNIPVISSLSGVGQHMWDHPYFVVGYRVNVTTASILNNPAALYQANADFLQSQTGPLANTGGNLIGWEKVPQRYRQNLSQSALEDLAQFPSDWPELELLPIAAATYPTNDTANYASITIACIAPLSRGNVTINSTNTDDPPLISPNWLTSKTDQEVAVQGFRVARDVAAASGITVGPEFQPGLTVQTDAQILEYLRTTSYTIHHAASTCKMGNVTDPMAVVSTTGKVYGVDSLRIVDASTFPLLPPGHCQATVYMLAEKYADDIKNGR